MALLWLRPGLQGGKALPFAVISYYPCLYSCGAQLFQTLPIRADTSHQVSALIGDICFVYVLGGYMLYSLIINSLSY